MKQKITITEETRLGELVTYFPAITSRLNELHIDYCCQGDRTLAAAAKDAGLKSDFITEVQNAYSDYLVRPDKELPVTELSDKQLIDLILEIHHTPERTLWNELEQLVNKILLVHYGHGKELLLKLHRSFSELKMELEEHFAKEEKELFPAMLESNNTDKEQAAIRSLILQLEGEHNQMVDLIFRAIQKFFNIKFAKTSIGNRSCRMNTMLNDFELTFKDIKNRKL